MDDINTVLSNPADSSLVDGLIKPCIFQSSIKRALVNSEDLVIKINYQVVFRQMNFI